MQLDETDSLSDRIATHLGVPASSITDWRFVKKSVDARRGHNPVFVVTVDASLHDEQSWYGLNSWRQDIEQVTTLPYEPAVPGNRSLEGRPVVIGAGPAGLFCGLTLATAGYAPIILERGDSIEERVNQTSRFWETGELDPESNVQFGEGGAGAFSDGKLTTRIRDPRCAHVLNTFVTAGAPEEIAWEHMPHIGTDRLRKVIPFITAEIRRLGGDVRFRSKVKDIKTDAAGKVLGVITSGDEFIKSGAVVLAVGHSARDTFTMLLARNVDISAKAFAVGLRIEHLQSMIDEAQYGPFAGHPLLPPATYRLAEKISAQRQAYTFCMCPGGAVLNAASEPGVVVTNGMSNLLRDGRNANSAIVVNVSQADFGSASPLAGMEYQRTIETRAYQLVKPGRMPVQHLGNFLKSRQIKVSKAVEPATAGKVDYADLNLLLPPAITATIRAALPLMGRKIHGFDFDGAVLSGPETRTSSPVRITRGEDRVSVSNQGLYPCGEGAGYAGGIVSAAVDGIHVAEAIIAEFKRS